MMNDDLMDGAMYVIEWAVRTPSGRRLVVKTNRAVSCASLSDVRVTMAEIVSHEIYAGRPAPTPAEACAAAWSVPDGAPIAMAADNVGCALTEAAADQMTRWQNAERALRRRFG